MVIVIVIFLGHFIDRLPASKVSSANSSTPFGLGNTTVCRVYVTGKAICTSGALVAYRTMTTRSESQVLALLSQNLA